MIPARMPGVMQLARKDPLAAISSPLVGMVILGMVVFAVLQRKQA